MTRKATPENGNKTDMPNSSDLQKRYLSTAAALGVSWCDFVGERFHAYAHMIDDVSHCHDVNEAFKIQADFGQQTLKAYSDQAAKVGGLVMQNTRGDAGNSRH